MESDNYTYIENSQTDYLIHVEKVEDIGNELLRYFNFHSTELNIQICTPESIQTLNTEYRSKDNATDVLSFPQLEWIQPIEFNLNEHSSPKKMDGPPLMLGDIVLCPEIAKINADSIGHGIDREICFLIVHGFLHLCGHDHMEQDEEEKMLEQQNQIMSHFMNQEAEPIWSNCAKEQVGN